MIDDCTGTPPMADRKGTVVHAFGAAPPSQLQQEILDFIDEFIADIKTGRIVAVAVAGVISDGGVSSGWRRSPESHFRLIGAVAELQYRLHSEGTKE